MTIYGIYASFLALSSEVIATLKVAFLSLYVIFLGCLVLFRFA